MEKHYFFFDIDGTLTDNATKRIVPSAKLALEKLIDAGHFVCIATGRAHYKALKTMQELGLHHMICNGGQGFVIDRRLVENRPLDKQKAIQILKEADEKRIGWLIMIDDSKTVYSRNDLFIQQVGFRKEPTRYIFDQSFDYQQIEKIYKIYLALDKKEEMNLTTKDTLGHLRFEDEYLMFQPDCKKEGIIKMMEYLNAPLEQVIVFGDDYNDLEMFDEKWVSVAMGNACRALKDKATFIAKRNVEDGIYEICKEKNWF